MSTPATPATLLDAIAASDGQFGPLAAAPAAEAPAAASRFVLLSIAATHYAVPEAYVTELERVPRITMVPQVPVWMRGVTNVRGDIVSVIDMRSFLGLEPHLPASARLLVVRLLDEPFVTGLIVDSVDRIVTVQTNTIKTPASPLEGPLAPYLSGVCEVGDRLVAVLDVDRLLRSTDIRQFDEPKDLHADAAPASVEDN
jgi:purine-binding chemotaxis protein CheW